MQQWKCQELTAATFDGLTIVQNTSAKEGVVFFKGAGIGGHFKNATITDNVTSATAAGAIHSNDVVAIDTVSFENVTLNGTSTEYYYRCFSCSTCSQV